MHKADPTTTPVSDIFVLPKHVVPKCHKFYDLIKFSCFINIDLAGNYRIYKDLEKYFFFWCTERDTRERSIYTNTNYCDDVYASQKHHSVKKYPGRLQEDNNIFA